MSWTYYFLTPLLIGAIQVYVYTKLRYQIKESNDRFIEDLKWESKVKEQAEKVAEYLAMIDNLETREDFEKANQLTWELAMWLPADTYRALTHAIIRPNKKVNKLTTVVEIRGLLLGNEKDPLTQDEIMHHSPGVGKYNVHKYNIEKLRD